MKYMGRSNINRLIIALSFLSAVTQCHTTKSQEAAAYNYSAADSIAKPVVAASPAQAGGPELPRFYLDTSYNPSTREPKLVAAGSNLQAAINAAQPGDVLTLQAGATFTGNFNLPAKPGSGWITIRSAAPDSSLPAPGKRITPDYANVLPKIVSPNSDPALIAKPGAHHYRFIGVEFTVGPKVAQNYNLIYLGDGETSTGQLSHDLIFDRVYIHGNPNVNLRRGIALNAAATAVIDSYISDIHEIGADAQALAVWNGPGPFKIVNNYLEASGDNFLAGGAIPTIPNLIPSDIEFQRNHCFKPLTWKVGEPNYAGKHWQVKNHFELKNSQRVLVNGNTFENNWLDAQVGFAILFTVRTEDGNAAWAVVNDVTFTNNILRHSGSGINISGSDEAPAIGDSRRIRIANNLFEDINGPRWGEADGRWLQIIAGPDEVIVEHNTVFQTGTLVYADGDPPCQGFVFRNNLAPHNAYGFFGSGVGSGTEALNRYFPGAVFKKNVIIGGTAKDYPPDNLFPATMDEIRFVDREKGNYRLSALSRYRKNGTDSKDIGVDFGALTATMSEGTPNDTKGDLKALDK
ncbi:MAG TPA: hypothetical protein VJ302_07675 [Blastocatellia bacterium]|nr:hypothetical protein [Blastocatellia bacterium]